VLTDLSLKKLAPPARGQMEVWDGRIPGFGIRVSTTGAKTFVLVYRHDGRPRRLTIGRYPALSLAEARAMAQQALASSARGQDPLAVKLEASPRDPLLFTNLLDEFVETHCKRHNKPSTAHETERILRSDFFPGWRAKRVDSIRKGDVLRVLDRLVSEGTPSAANHAFAAVRKYFNWCVQRGYIDVSPCLGVQSPAKHKSRDRVLSDDELALAWRHAPGCSYPFEQIVRLLILTAQRRGEVALMQWSHVDLRDGLWSIPAEMTKSNRPHTVPLVKEAVDILAKLPRLDEALVFPSKKMPGQAWDGFTKAKWRLDAHVGFRDWTLHDLRRTVATGMARLGVAPHVVERILNHTSGSLGGVAGVYNRFGYLPEMRAALELWARHVVSLTSAERAVVLMPAASKTAS
jgi:integrase